MAIQLRPSTPYMMKARPLSLKRSGLSPRRARLDWLLPSEFTISWATLSSRGVGGSAFGAAGRSRRWMAKMSSMPTTPTEARRNRGASARN